MSDESGERQPDTQRVRPLYVWLAIGAVLFALAFLFLPAWDFLVQPLDPAVRDDISEAIEEADPAEKASLRLELERLVQEVSARRSGLRTTIATLLAGSVAAVGAVAAWRQLQDNRREAEATQQRTDRQLQLAREELEDNRRQAEAAQRDTNEQLRLARDAQLTERFTRAVGQLGDDRLDVKLGGIYALKRIAADSETDLPTVVEVLTAFVRGHSPLQHPIDGKESQPAGSDSPSGDDGEGARPQPLSRRAADVQAAMTVIGRMKREPGSVDLDLSRTDLASVSLGGANLEGAEFHGANLRHAMLNGTDLRKAGLQGANLQGARLEEANLGGAILKGASLQSASLGEANLQDAMLDGADLQEAGLLMANMKGAMLEEANLKDAMLEGANLEGACYTNAKLVGARLSGANLKGAVLNGANLRLATLEWANLEDAQLDAAKLAKARLCEANLKGARLWAARLEHADLRGSNLEGADLTGADLTGVKANADTRWPGGPAGFDTDAAQAAGVIFVDRDDSTGGDQAPAPE